MVFDPDLAEIRFGCGLSPAIDAPRDIESMLSGLHGPDEIAERFPIQPFDDFRARMVEMQALYKKRSKVRGTPEGEALRKQQNLVKKAARQDMLGWLGQTLLRRAHTKTALRERLVYFWADHFTAYGKAGVIKRATSPYIEEAIRPHLTGRFSDLLFACVTHPVMLHFLDQHKSIGPNSVAAARRGKSRGLNENLAREVLELHTLGVDGPYNQTDVRELAELFAGMSFQPNRGFKFRKDYSEPGAETVLGTTYDGKPTMAPVRAALDDLAAHPATAQHIARKLAVHFVSDDPDPALVTHLATRFRETDGDLAQVYQALLEHDAAWQPGLGNAKLPVDFVASTLRALNVAPERIQPLTEKEMRQGFLRPMAMMGQIWQLPIGPDGWPEEDGHWLTPQGLSARITWAMAAPEQLVPSLPDPREFVRTALGSYASEAVQFAAGAAESKSEAIGLVLSCPAFQKR
ncbi:DUF1800 domain-containing protein [Aliishimia ponticola]|uniref:DUF1800 domain-containing protein n=1 Tax=Aliishimia ponticola TaxID=2499833 RepID=A0A4S4NEM2_9RHOB|nr:DUF1800 domain-containing protein [Aliishimia ponticola]THH36568.1 DUF1800 domain-containing protein [Aliishimia ponticola]